VLSVVILISAVLVLSSGKPARQHTEIDDREFHTNAAKRFTPATVVGVSNYDDSDGRYIVTML